MTQPAKKTGPPATPSPNRRLIISLKQTEDQSGDIARLRKINEIIMEFKGSDEVILRVENGTKTDVIQLHDTGYCPELYNRLVELMGEGKIAVETR
jgi:hypothetical protein